MKHYLILKSEKMKLVLTSCLQLRPGSRHELWTWGSSPGVSASAQPGVTIVNGANASGGCRGGGSTSNIEWMAERMTGSKSGQSENGWGCDLWGCSPNCVMIELNWIQLRWAELNPTESSWQALSLQQNDLWRNLFYFFLPVSKYV